MGFCNHTVSDGSLFVHNMWRRPSLIGKLTTFRGALNRFFPLPGCVDDSWLLKSRRFGSLWGNRGQIEMGNGRSKYHIGVCTHLSTSAVWEFCFHWSVAQQKETVALGLPKKQRENMEKTVQNITGGNINAGFLFSRWVTPSKTPMNI